MRNKDPFALNISISISNFSSSLLCAQYLLLSCVSDPVDLFLRTFRLTWEHEFVETRDISWRRWALFWFVSPFSFWFLLETHLWRLKFCQTRVTFCVSFAKSVVFVCDTQRVHACSWSTTTYNRELTVEINYCLVMKVMGFSLDSAHLFCLGTRALLICSRRMPSSSTIRLLI